MSVTIHLVMLAVPILVAIFCIAARPGHGSSPRVFKGVLPFLILGLLCSLLMSANGKPVAEWLIPLIAVLAVAIWCRSDTLFRVATGTLFLIAVGLCANFMHLIIDGGYTAEPEWMKRYAQHRQRIALKQAAKHLPPAPGPAGSTHEVTITPAWHTPITRLHRLTFTERVLWFDGEKIEVRPAD